MPVLRAHDPHHRQRLVRRVTCVRGRARVATPWRLAGHGPRGCARSGPTAACCSGRRRSCSVTGRRASGWGSAPPWTCEVVRRRGDGRGRAGARRDGAVRAGGAGRGARSRTRAPRRTTRRRCSTATTAFWRGWLAHLDVHGALAGDGQPLRADPEAAHPRAERGDRRRPDHQPARADRRRAQLGLPLRLDPRRRLQPVRPAAARLHRRGGRVHALAVRAPGGRRQSTTTTWARCGCSTTSTARAEGGASPRPPERLPRLASGAGRQRRRRPAPARHLRRADRLGLPLQQVRRRGSATTPGADLTRDPRLGDWTTGSATTRACGRSAASRRPTPPRG